MKKTATLILISLLLVMASSLTISQSAATLENSWTTKASMPRPIVFPGAAVINGKIYVVGAYTEEDKNNSLYEYDPASDVWTIKTSMPSSRVHFGIASCNNKIYVIGGHNPREQAANLNPFSTNEAYDPVTDSWETRASMPTARWGIIAETVNGKIYVISGSTGGAYSTVNVNKVYDSTTDSWTQASGIPTPVTGPASAVVDGRIHVIGGQAEFNDPMNPGLNQIYDPETDAWTQGAKEPNPAWNSAGGGATTGEMAPVMIYVMGGRPGFAPPIDQNYAYNPEKDEWTVAASLQAARAGFAVAVVKDLLYVMGGATEELLAITAAVEQYTPIGYGFEVSPQPSPSSPLSPFPSPPSNSSPSLSSTATPSASPTPDPAIPEFTSFAVPVFMIATAPIIATAAKVFVLHKRKK